jgi:hypothetical protein
MGMGGVVGERGASILQVDLLALLIHHFRLLVISCHLRSLLIHVQGVVSGLTTT